MIRELQVVTGKHAPAQYVAGEEMIRGMSVKIDYTTGKVKKNTGATEYLVNVTPNYDGMNAVIDPQEKDFENIKVGDKVVLIPVVKTEAYAVSNVTKGSLVAGDRIDATSGVFAAAVTSGTATAGDFIYDGEYSDPTGITMYRIVKA